MKKNDQKNKIRILLAEDHATVREGIKLLINAQDNLEVIGEAENGEIAVEKAIELTPDFIIMDVSMPELNGLKATQRIKREAPEIKILTLTRHTDDGYLQQLLRAGANGYVLKQSAPSELIRAILAVASGEGYLDPSLTKKVMGGYVSRATSMRGENKSEITDREAEVLSKIARGYSNKKIGEILEISVKTVEAHKANAMKKLNMKSRIDIVRYAILQDWMEEN